MASASARTWEIAEPVALPVSEALPSCLQGTLLRTGPSKFEVGARSCNHWFDGLAMLHSFVFADGGVPWPSRQTEHDGVLLSIVLDIERGRSFLLVLHPASLNELARAEAPHAIPLHFHGNYFPGAA